MPAKNKKVMRKIYLLITSALLLIGSGTLWAATVATVDGEEFETIDAAISAWKASGKTTLTLLADCEYNASSYIYPWGNKTLDLNGKKLTWNFTQNNYCFINEDGLSIEDSDSQHNGELIINANWGIINFGSNSATTLNISNCKLSGTGCLILDNIGSVNIDNAEIVSNSASVVMVENGELNVTGKSIIQSSTKNGAIALYGSVEDVANYSNLTIGKDVTVNAPDGWGVTIFSKEYNNKSNSNYKEDQKKAFGVNVNINGAINAKQGITINGCVNQVTGNVPVININDGAILNCSSSVGADIYAAGYGIWNIGAATLKAGTPIYAKSGVINIDGATIEACGEYAEPKPYGNGFHSTGDGIVFDSKNGYAGNMSIAITDATITSANGYAIQEVLTDREESQTLSMQILDGKFKGSKGTIVTSEHFGESTPTHWADNSIVGGKYAYAPTTVADGYKVAFNTDADKNEFPYIIVVDDLYPTGTITEITDDTSVDDVVTVADNDGLVIKTGVTYTVKGLVIGTGVNSKSKVTVEAGAKLIVGEYGIVNYANNQLVLQADKDNGCAILRFDGTTSNLNPYGKVDLYMYAHKEENDVYVWQHIGLPTAGAPDEIAKSAPYLFNVWDLKKGWQYAAQDLVNAPWTGYNSTTNMEAPGSKLTFTGQLVGGSDAEFVLAPNNYSCIANSYTDYVSIAGFINQLPEGETDGTVWVYGMGDDGKVGFTLYNSSSFFLKPDPGFSPMQAFFIKNVTSNEIQMTVPYGGMGTVRDAVANEINGGIIKLSDGHETAELQIIESPEYSDEIKASEGDAEQFATDMIQIYVKQGTKNLAAIGTNSLDGKEIEIVTKSATQYTLSFEYLKGKAFKLVDLASGAEVEVGSDKTYTFTADANSTIKRFRLGEGEVSANEANADVVKIWSANGSLFVEGNTAEADIEIINLGGVKVASAKANGEAVQAVSISNLASGVYVVRVGNTAAKIVK